MKLSASNAISDGKSTLVATIHADADTLEWFKIEGGELLEDYPPAERRRMAASGMAMRDGSFPISNCAEAELADAARGRAPRESREALRDYIDRRFTALRCNE